jgi:hypothetical protein
VLGIFGWVAVSVVSFVYLARAMDAISTQMAAEGPSPVLGARVGRVVLLARVLILVLFAIVFVMVVKPGT